MTALTTAQLDELERRAKDAAGAGWSTAHAYCDDVLRLVAIARAALAWRTARTVPGIAAEREAAHALIAAIDGES